MYHLIVHARTTLSIWMLSRALALPASFKKKRPCAFAVYITLFFFFFGWWNYVIGFGRPSADSLFKRIMELTLCLWMEIKLVWMRDLGDGAGLWDSPSLSLSAIAFLNRVLTSCVRRKGKMPPVHAVRTWSERPTPHFHIKDTCEGCCTVLTCKKKRKETLTLTLPFHCSPFLSVFSLFYYSPSVSRRVLTFSFFPWTDALFLCHLNFLFLFWFWFFLLLSRSPSPLSSPPHILWSLFDEAPENRLLSHRGQAAQTAAVPSLLQRDPRVLTFEPSSMK